MHVSRIFSAATLAFIVVLVCGGASGAQSHETAAAHIQQTAARAPPVDENLFLAANKAAMTKMMSDMSVKGTGDVDRDFVAMMIPHHQGAVDMAKAVLRYGHNEQLQRLAQEIIVTQQEEIVAMRLAIGEPALPRIPPATSP